jgi:hypothetical protein
VEDWLESAPETVDYSNSYKEGPMEDLEPLNPIESRPQTSNNSSSKSSQGTAVNNLKKITAAVAEIRTAPLSKLIFYMRVSTSTPCCKKSNRI